MDAVALLGFAMPTRPSMFSNKINNSVLNADALAGIAKPARVSASISVIIPMNFEVMSGFVPTGPQGFWMSIPNIQQR